LALVQQYEQRLQALQQQVEDLRQRLNQNSTNSSRPPATDPPHVKRRPPKLSSARQRGGQPGHARHQRPLVPPEQVKQAMRGISSRSGITHGGQQVGLSSSLKTWEKEPSSDSMSVRPAKWQ